MAKDKSLPSICPSKACIDKRCFEVVIMQTAKLR
jgi:hypothetical protein